MNLTDLNDSQIVSVVDINNNFKAINTADNAIADRVTSVTTSGIWTVERWESGKLKCWGRTAVFAVSATTSDGTGYYGSISSVATLPSGFIAVPVISATTSIEGSGIFWGSLWGPQTTSAKIGMTFASPSSTTSTARVSFECVGRWK